MKFSFFGFSFRYPVWGDPNLYPGNGSAHKKKIDTLGVQLYCSWIQPKHFPSRGNALSLNPGLRHYSQLIWILVSLTSGGAELKWGTACHHGSKFLYIKFLTLIPPFVSLAFDSSPWKLILNCLATPPSWECYNMSKTGNYFFLYSISRDKSNDRTRWRILSYIVRNWNHERIKSLLTVSFLNEKFKE